MSWKLLIEVLILPVLVLCAVVPQPLDTDILLQGPFNIPALSFSKNSSAAIDNSSLSNIPKLRCDPIRYGRNLNVGSCRKVFNFVAPSDTQTIFGDRSSLEPHDLDLPFRFTSSKCLNISGSLHWSILRRKARTGISTC